MPKKSETVPNSSPHRLATKRGYSPKSKRDRKLYQSLSCCFGVKYDKNKTLDPTTESVEPRNEDVAEQGDRINELVVSSTQNASDNMKYHNAEVKSIQSLSHQECGSIYSIGQKLSELYDKESHGILMNQDCLNPILMAATEVVSASKMLSDALELLKRNSMCSQDQTNVKGKAVSEANVTKSWDFEAVISSDCCTELVLDIPPINAICQIEARTAEHGDQVFHQAASNVRICIEDQDAVEPVRNSVNDSSMTSVNEILSLPKRDIFSKSFYPISTPPSPPLTFTLTDDSKHLHHAVEHVLSDIHSNCQTIVTGKFRPCSTEETQVTDFDDGLSTDESEPSEHRPQSYYFDQTRLNDIRGIKKHSSVCNRPIHSCTGDFQPLSMKKLKQASNGITPKDSWDSSLTDAFIGDHQAVPSRHKRFPFSKTTQSHTTLHYVDSRLWDCSRSSKVNHAAPDSEDASFEMMYQRNNHNRKLNVETDTSELDISTYAVENKSEATRDENKLITCSSDHNEILEGATNARESIVGQDSIYSVISPLKKCTRLDKNIRQLSQSRNQLSCSIEVELTPDFEPLPSKHCSTPYNQL